MLRPRIVLRLVLYAAISWLGKSSPQSLVGSQNNSPLKVLAALYAGLPSFSRDDDGTAYATSVLNSGGTLTRVYGYVESFLML